jgi:hypothetical protein
MREPETNEACAEATEQEAVAMGADGASYAVIGRSDDEPVLYHANKSWEEAERLRQQREATTGRACYVVELAAWLANPRQVLRHAEAERFG